jgi:hypothetical protein
MIEIMTFRLGPGVEESEFLAADRALQEDFAYQQPGMLRRTLANGDSGSWIVIDLWHTRADREACAQRWEEDLVARRFMSFIEPGSITYALYEQLD